jgi:hypothetical protein
MSTSECRGERGRERERVHVHEDGWTVAVMMVNKVVRVRLKTAVEGRSGAATMRGAGATLPAGVREGDGKRRGDARDTATQRASRWCGARRLRHSNGRSRGRQRGSTCGARCRPSSAQRQTVATGARRARVGRRKIHTHGGGRRLCVRLRWSREIWRRHGWRPGHPTRSAPLLLPPPRRRYNSARLSRRVRAPITIPSFGTGAGDDTRVIPSAALCLPAGPVVPESTPSLRVPPPHDTSAPLT